MSKHLLGWYRKLLSEHTEKYIYTHLCKGGVQIWKTWGLDLASYRKENGWGTKSVRMQILNVFRIEIRKLQSLALLLTFLICTLTYT